MLRLPLALVVLLVAACTAGPSVSSPSPSGGAPIPPGGTASKATPTIPPVLLNTPTPAPSESPISHGPAGLVNDLTARGFRAEQVTEFAGEPLSNLGVQLCVEGEPVQVYVYGIPQQAAAAAAQFDPDDPSNLGTTIIDWAGEPKFWLRDRIVVLYLRTDEDVEAALVELLGEPFARGEGRPPLLGGDDC